MGTCHLGVGDPVFQSRTNDGKALLCLCSLDLSERCKWDRGLRYDKLSPRRESLPIICSPSQYIRTFTELSKFCSCNSKIYNADRSWSQACGNALMVHFLSWSSGVPCFKQNEQRSSFELVHTIFREVLSTGGCYQGGGPASNPCWFPLGAVIAVAILVDVHLSRWIMSQQNRSGHLGITLLGALAGSCRT